VVKVMLYTRVSRTITFPDRRFLYKLYEGILTYTMCVNTSSIGLVTDRADRHLN